MSDTPAPPSSLANQTAFNQALLDFLAGSPSPYHAVDNLRRMLESRGYQQLREDDAWELSAGGQYYVVRDEGSLIAFSMGARDALAYGLRLAGAHTDSPALKVKPNPEISRNGYWQLGVEVYGGALLNPWFDRDLSIAGRVSFTNTAGQLCSGRVDFEKPLGVIPSLAIHLDKDANKNRTVNPQQHLPVLLACGDKTSKADFRALLKDRLGMEGYSDVVRVLDYDLLFYPAEAPALVGLDDEFIAAARLDNLLSCYLCLAGLLSADSDLPCMVVFNDHEEVGSVSASGAAGSFLESVLARVYPGTEARTRILDRSCLFSVDNAHAVHPNYADVHDTRHGPVLNGGPVLKINGNQRYATNSHTSSLYQVLSEQARCPFQRFVVRSDMGCGSTIGPITSAALGVATLDLGVPTLAMHSCRELAGSQDAWMLFQVLQAFFNQKQLTAIPSPTP